MSESAPAVVARVTTVRGGDKIYSRSMFWMFVASSAVAVIGAGAFILVLGERDTGKMALILLLFLVLGWITALLNFFVLNWVLRRFMLQLSVEMAALCGLTANVSSEPHIDQVIRNFLVVFRRVLGAFRDKTSIVKRVATVSRITLDESATEIERIKKLLSDLEAQQEKIVLHRQHWEEGRERVKQLVLPAEQLLRLQAAPEEMESLRTTAVQAADTVGKLRVFVDDFNSAAEPLRDKAGYWQRVPEILEESNGKLNLAALQLAGIAGRENDKFLPHAERLRELAETLQRQADLMRQGGTAYADALQQMDRMIMGARELLHRSAHDLEEASRSMAGTIEFVDAHRSQLQSIFANLEGRNLQSSVGEMLLQTLTALEGHEETVGALLNGMKDEVNNLRRLREVTEEISPIIEELNQIMFDFSNGAT